MSVYTTEEEQIEAIKAWWKSNGKAVVAGLVLGLAILAGGKLWMNHQRSVSTAASGEYSELMAALNQGKNDQVLQHGAIIVDQYAGTSYAALASLAMAKVEFDQGSLDAAKNHLQWVIDHARQQDLKHVARLRIAKVLTAQGKDDDALALLNSVDPGTFKPAYRELEGDIYVKQGKKDLARSAYESALAAMPQGVDQKYLRMKVDDLGAKDGS